MPLGSSPQMSARAKSATDHGALGGLADDDHAQYLLADGTRGLSADWDGGPHQIRAETGHYDVATGTAPLVVASTTLVANLNADKLDGYEASELLALAGGANAFVKQPCRVCTTGNITLAGDQTLDGVNLDASDRVLVAFQADQTENGIYVVDTGSGSPWTRATDLAAAANARGILVAVNEGTTYQDTLWICTADKSADVVGTNNLEWRPIASPGGIPEIANTDAATVTFDLRKNNSHKVTLAGNRTLALSNARIGQRFLLKLTQDGTGSRTVTWFTTISWAGGTPPTLTTTASKSDLFGFVCTGSGTYDGHVVGTNI